MQPARVLKPLGDRWGHSLGVEIHQGQSRPACTVGDEFGCSRDHVRRRRLVQFAEGRRCPKVDAIRQVRPKRAQRNRLVGGKTLEQGGKLVQIGDPDPASSSPRHNAGTAVGTQPPVRAEENPFGEWAARLGKSR